MSMLKLSKKDLLLKEPEFWVTFGNAEAEDHNIDVRGQDFQLLVTYMSDAEYQAKIQKKAEVKEKGISRKIAPTTSLIQLAELQAKLLVKDWKMPADRFVLSVTLDPAVIADQTNGKGFTPEDMIEFDQDICAEFLKADWGYTNFVQESCHKAYLANAKAEVKATGNLSAASESA